MRRNEARERALSEMLKAHREQCARAKARTTESNQLAYLYESASLAAIDKIYAIMRPTWKPAP